MLCVADNTIRIASLLFSSACSSQYLGGASAVSQNITSLLNLTALTAQDKALVVAQAIVLGLEQRQPQAVATLVATALVSNDSAAIMDGFAQVSLCG